MLLGDIVHFPKLEFFKQLRGLNQLRQNALARGSHPQAVSNCLLNIRRYGNLNDHVPGVVSVHGGLGQGLVHGVM